MWCTVYKDNQSSYYVKTACKKESDSEKIVKWVFFQGILFSKAIV